mgnify:CR=1 FL=1
MNNKIAEWRERIDDIDEKLLWLLSERKKAILEIGKVKKENGWKIADKKREKEIFDKLRKKAFESGLNEKYVVSLFKEIIKNSKKEER